MRKLFILLLLVLFALLFVRNQAAKSNQQQTTVSVQPTSSKAAEIGNQLYGRIPQRQDMVRQLGLGYLYLEGQEKFIDKTFQVQSIDEKNVSVYSVRVVNRVEGRVVEVERTKGPIGQLFRIEENDLKAKAVAVGDVFTVRLYQIEHVPTLVFKYEGWFHPVNYPTPTPAKK